MTNTTTLAHVLRPRDYISAGRSHLFPSPTSFKWYVRQHRDELIKRGAIVKVCGRTHVVEQPMDMAVLELGATAMLHEAEVA